MRLLVTALFASLALPALASDRPVPPAPWAYDLLAPARGVLHMVTGAEVTVTETYPQQMTLTIKAVAESPNWTNLTLEPLLTLVPSEDGLYDAVLLGTPPMELTELIWDNVEFTVTWNLREVPKMLKLHAELNCLVILLDQPEPAPDFRDCEVMRAAGFPRTVTP